MGEGFSLRKESLILPQLLQTEFLLQVNAINQSVLNKDMILLLRRIILVVLHQRMLRSLIDRSREK